MLPQQANIQYRISKIVHLVVLFLNVLIVFKQWLRRQCLNVRPSMSRCCTRRRYRRSNNTSLMDPYLPASQVADAVQNRVDRDIRLTGMPWQLCALTALCWRTQTHRHLQERLVELIAIIHSTGVKSMSALLDSTH